MCSIKNALPCKLNERPSNDSNMWKQEKKSGAFFLRCAEVVELCNHLQDFHWDKDTQWAEQLLSMDQEAGLSLFLGLFVLVAFVNFCCCQKEAAACEKGAAKTSAISIDQNNFFLVFYHPLLCCIISSL